MDLVVCIDERCSTLLAEFKVGGNPILNSFFEKKEHQELYHRVIVEPSFENAQALDVAFRLFFYEIRLIKYVTTLIHNYAIDTVKRYRTHFQRNLYILDNDIQYEGNSLPSLEHLASDCSSDPANLFEKNCNDLTQCVSNKNLKEALRVLNQKQKKVLELFYVMGLDNQSVARYFNESCQNISKMHNRTLVKLNKRMVYLNGK